MQTITNRPFRIGRKGREDSRNEDAASEGREASIEIFFPLEEREKEKRERD